MRRGEVYLADLDPIAICHQLRALDKAGLVECWGLLSSPRIAEIERTVLQTLGIHR